MKFLVPDSGVENLGCVLVCDGLRVMLCSNNW